MRGTLIPAIAASLAVLIFAGAKPALSAPAPAALAYGETQAGLVQDIGHKRYVRKWRGQYPYYAYRYRPYGYYYRPYAYYDYPYSYDYPYYYARPGISFWFGF